VPEQLLNVLKLCLLALLYLFFLRVVRAVWVEVNGPRLRKAPATPPPVPVAAPTGSVSRRDRKARRGGGADSGPALVVLAPPDQHGRSYALGDELTIGRAAGCQITLDDTYVSQLHARVFLRDGAYYVEDLGSTNGTYLNRKKVSGPLLAKPGDQLQVGSVVLEVRT
jgi:pSer/pThr/pTyr-binding forkhead associated (FHA) protein